MIRRIYGRLVREYRSLPHVRRRRTRRARAAWGCEHVVFVCYGNICRSPFAEVIARQHSAPGRTVVSAGSYPENGRRSPEPAVAAAKGWEVDLAAHRSRILDDEMAREAGAIFVFDRQNYRHVVGETPAGRSKVHYIGALADHGPLEVPDPFGGPIEGYQEAYGRIAELVASAEEASRGWAGRA